MSFSFPGPRKLSEITNLPLLAKEEPEAIKEIWKAYHETRQDTLAHTLSADELASLVAHAKKCPLFVLPVFRDGGHFMLLSQFQEQHFLLAFLEDYKLNPATAPPYMTVSTYAEMVQDKGLGLIRADVTPHLKRQEAERVLQLLLQCYLQSEEFRHHVENFNLRPDHFSLDGFMAKAQDVWQADTDAKGILPEPGSL